MGAAACLAPDDLTSFVFCCYPFELKIRGFSGEVTSPLYNLTAMNYIHIYMEFA